MGLFGKSKLEEAHDNFNALAEKRNKRRRDGEKNRQKRVNKMNAEVRKLKSSVKKLLKDKNEKMTISDIAGFLKRKNNSELKKICESLYHNGQISRTANYRYFILTEEKKKPKPKKASAPKSEEVDVEKELEKLKGLLDKGLITQEDYDAKKKELLGL